MTIRIETERLILRPPSPEDAGPACAMMADVEVARFITLDGKAQDKPTAWRGFAGILGHWQIRGFGFFTVLDRASGEYLGRVGPWMPEGWPGLEAGWTIARPHWGKGYAPEAAIASIRWTFEKFPNLSRIISVIDPQNTNSRAVAARIGESISGEIFEFWGMKLDVWGAGRQAWLRRFGRDGSAK